MLSRFLKSFAALALALWCLFSVAPAQAADDLYTVSGVHVDASGASSAEALNVAIAQGRPKAWQILYRRLTRQQDWSRQPVLDAPAQPLDLSVGGPDTSLFPLAVWRRLVSATLRPSLLTATAYEGGGHRDLQREVARYVGLSRSVVAGPDVDRHVEQLRSYVDAGYDEVYVANMGPHYREMIRAYGTDVLPRMRS